VQDSLVICTHFAPADRYLTTLRVARLGATKPTKVWELHGPRYRAVLTFFTRATRLCPHEYPCSRWVIRAVPRSVGSASACNPPLTQNPDLERQDVDECEPLRPLTSLKWPYVPEESAYPDPLKRDDPKIIQLPQYEAIGNWPLLVHIASNPSHTLLSATSAAVRRAFSEHPNLKPLLRSIDSLRGIERETALQRVLGVSQTDHHGDSSIDRLGIGEEDIEAAQQLSSVIEAAVRGDRPSALGLDLNGER
jgi:hypothetical protein